METALVILILIVGVVCNLICASAMAKEGGVWSEMIYGNPRMEENEEKENS